MTARPAKGVLTISIDWSADSVGFDLVAQRALARLGDNLAALFDALKLPATLAVADPTATSKIERFSASQIGHEIAILGDVNLARSHARVLLRDGGHVAALQFEGAGRG